MVRIRVPFPIAMVWELGFGPQIFAPPTQIFAPPFVDATMFFFVFLTRFLFRIYKILGILQSQQAIILIIFLTNF